MLLFVRVNFLTAVANCCLFTVTICLLGSFNTVTELQLALTVDFGVDIVPATGQQ